MPSRTPGPDEVVRLVYAARQYYVEGRTRVEIADRLGVSRFKVARMLENATKLGVVRFQIASPGPVDADLSLALRERFGLRRAVVVRTPTQDPPTVQEHLGEVAAGLLSEILEPEDVVGMTAGRTLSQMASRVRNLPRVQVVQLAGVAGFRQATGVEVIRRVSTAAGGRAWNLFAPILASDPAAAEAIRRQPETQATFQQFPRVTLALVAIGSWVPPDSEFATNSALSADDRKRLLAAGVRADVGAVLLDGDGKPIDLLRDRCVAIDAAGLAGINEVIGVAGGEFKTDAVRAALDSGLLNSLVSDKALAERLMGLPS